MSGGRLKHYLTLNKDITQPCLIFKKRIKFLDLNIENYKSTQTKKS